MLTKSEVLSWRQCPRKLWLERQNPDREEGSSLDRRARDGVRVGEVARAQLGDGYLWPAANDDKEQASRDACTALLAEPSRAGVEVPIVRNEVFVRVDALVPVGGTWMLRETKASGFPLKADKVTPGKAKDHYLDDAAIQAWAVDGSPLRCGAVELNLLNNQWRLPTDGAFDGLFRQLDVTADIAERRAQVPSWVAQATAVLAGARPPATTGAHCGNPYECRFREACQAEEPLPDPHPLSLLPGPSGKKLAKKLAEAGYTSLVGVPPELLEGTESALYQRMQRAHQIGEAILEPAARERMEGYAYPRYFLDFEGIDFPVPQWPGARPYEQIPFQFSCHIEHTPGQFRHVEHLDISGNDPSRPLFDALCKVVNVSPTAPIFVWGASYEKTSLKNLAIRHAEHSGAVGMLVDRMVDLIPLVREFYYHPHMKGGFSVKSVLTTVAPELDYKALEEVQEGTAAQVAFMRLIFDDLHALRRAELEQHLRTYCRQDTWAMVEVAHRLAHRSRPNRPSE
jgi:hypothetical protein